MLDKAKKRKIALIAACVVILAGVFLGVEYNKYREKPLIQIIPFSRDEISEMQAQYSSNDHSVLLDAQQIAELWDILDDCTVKFWSTSDHPARYGDMWLWFDSAVPSSEEIKDVIITFSDNGHVCVHKLGTSSPKYSPVYRLVQGEEAIYQFLDKLEGQE